ncbi:hypothetical protein KI387_023836, partial [Taxus chinensis]
NENVTSDCESTTCNGNRPFEITSNTKNNSEKQIKENSEHTMLDLYAGCKALSTGICIGASLSGVNLVTKSKINKNGTIYVKMALFGLSNNEAPFDDYKNHQLVVFMETVEFLKPGYVLLENVVDVIKWSERLLGRYALSRLNLPQFPLPTHDVILRGGIPREWE